ncbi:MAG: CpaD family pilus assembly protein [Methylovirgula sp.]
MPTPPESNRLRTFLLSFGIAVALGGCADIDRMSTSSMTTDDYRDRHPIVLAEQERRLDIFPSPEIRGLDSHSAAQVAEFGTLYRNTGAGPINVFIPALQRGALAPATVAEIRRALAVGGAVAPLKISTYPVINRNLASPVRLSFVGLKAKVADPCGQWPSDLASGSSTQGWENKQYWNYGCSYQSMLAEQVADPRDLVGPRAEDPADTLMRSRAISEIRKGTDPGTDWKTKNSAISTVGSQ